MADNNPRNNGIAEQVQNGLIIPKSEANTLPKYFFQEAKMNE